MLNKITAVFLNLVDQTISSHNILYIDNSSLHNSKIKIAPVIGGKKKGLTLSLIFGSLI